MNNNDKQSRPGKRHVTRIQAIQGKQRQGIIQHRPFSRTKNGLVKTKTSLALSSSSQTNDSSKHNTKSQINGNKQQNDNLEEPTKQETQPDNEKHNQTPKANNKAKNDNDNLMAWSLALTYFTVMGAKCALPSVLSLLLQEPPVGLQFNTNVATAAATAVTSSKQQAMATLLTFSTLAVAAGKLVLGPLIDLMGGRRFLQYTLAILATLFAYLSGICNTFTGFFVAWMGVDFIFSSCWASCLSAIHQSFPPNRWSTLIGNLATGARAGNAVAFAVFAQVLKQLQQKQQQQATMTMTTTMQPWRWIFGLSAVAQLVPLAMLLYASRQANRQEKMLQGSASSSTLSKRVNCESKDLKTEQSTNESGSGITTTTTKPSSPLRLALTEMKRLNFWMHFASRSVLMVFASFLLFVPSYMSQAYEGASNAFGSQTGSVYALGCLLAVTVGTQGYNKFVTATSMTAMTQAADVNKSNNSSSGWTRAKKKTLALTGMLAAATLSSAAQWAHCANQFTLTPIVGSALFFLWGLSMAIPFYIPPSLYALKRGGTDCSATIMDLFDIGGFGLLASFNGYVAKITGGNSALDIVAARKTWVPTFAMTTACAIFSLITLGIASWREGRDEKDW